MDEGGVCLLIRAFNPSLLVNIFEYKKCSVRNIKGYRKNRQ